MKFDNYDLDFKVLNIDKTRVANVYSYLGNSF